MKIILLVDIQEGYMRDELRNLPKDIEKHIKNYDYYLVIATRFINKNDSLHKADIHIKDMTVFSSKAKLVEPIEKISDFVLMKSTYTSLTEDVVKLLEKNQVKQVYIAGLNTETSILATAFDLFDKGIKPVILSHLCNSVNGQEINKAALDILRKAVGDECVL
ncbi:MAG: isochorismatase family protein [Cellulosilyticum sp.]|nr:isochorismatase family protein [Cellulosilyticum sp.]